MISVICSGGLGNQMFQYAFCRQLASQGLKAELDISYFKYNSVHSGYELDKCFGINEANEKSLYFSKKWKLIYSLMTKCRLKRMHNVILEGYNHNIDLEKKNYVFYGYWQSEECFRNIKDSIKEAFIFRNISSESTNLVNELTCPNSVAIHVRRGDYLTTSRFFNLSESDYYKNAIDTILEEIPEAKFFVFSDDIEWCRNNMGLPNATRYVDFNTGDRSYEDLFLMSKAPSIILANSSFSWWAGYLGEHKRVYRPSKYKVEWSESEDKYLFPKEWIKIEVIN